MINCLKDLISVDTCNASENACAVFSFNDIPWYSDVRAGAFNDSRYVSLTDFKEKMIKLAAIELSNEITSYNASGVQLKDVIGYYNSYSSQDLGCVSGDFSKGLLIKRTCECDAVRIRLDRFCIYHKPDNSIPSITISIQLDGGVSIPYVVNLSPTGVTCFGNICDADGNKLSAKNSILIFTNHDSIQLVKHKIPCQTGCHNAPKNDCLFVEGLHDGKYDSSYTYGIEAVASCYCDFSELFCSGVDKEKMATLLLYKLEYKVAEYALLSNRTDMFKNNLELITARINKQAEQYKIEFKNYLDSTYKLLASNTRYRKCVTCNGIVYGNN